MGLLQILLVLACAAVFIVCDTLSAVWGQTLDPKYLTIIFGLAPIGYLLFGKITISQGLAISSGFINCIIVITTVFIGVFIFGEVLSTRQIAGLVFAVAAILLVS